MAVVITKSTFISNIETGLRTFNDVRQAGAQLKVATATVEVAAADDDGSIYDFVRLPSQAIVYSALIMSDAIAAATDYDLGVYTPVEGGTPTAVDADCLADGVDINAGFAVPTELLGHTGGKPDPADYGQKPLWEQAGVSADPGDDTLYDICLTANTVGTAAGTISLAIIYAVMGN